MSHRVIAAAVVLVLGGAGTPPPEAVGDVVEVVAGSMVYAHAGCVRTRAGAVHCWGGPNVFSRFTKGRDEPLPGPWKVEGLEETAKLGRGVGHCAVTAGGAVRCFSGKDVGKDAGVTGAADVATGSGHACALLADGTVSCWGGNLNCALGRGTSGCDSQPRPPAPVLGVSDAVQLDVAAYGGCVVRKDHRVLCWGDHPFRTTGGAARDLALHEIPELAGARKISAGCALLERRAVCLRVDGAKDLVELKPAGLGDAIDVSSDGKYAAFVRADGSVWQWGPGPSPYMLDETWQKRAAKTYGKATQVKGIADAVQVSASTTHACAVTRSGHARCWGNNDFGQLGDGTLKSSATPTWVVRFEPDMLPDPKPGVFSCTATPELRRSCFQAGESCTLEPPPGYWDWGSRGGARMTDEEMREEQERLKLRPMPGCMCSCSDEFRNLRRAHDERIRNESMIP